MQFRRLGISLLMLNGIMHTEAAVYPSQLEVTIKPGYHRSLFLLEGMFPLYDKADEYLSFLNVRSHWDDQSSREYNLGLGARYRVPNIEWFQEAVVVGAYAFYDYRQVATHQIYHQGTFGVELLNPWLEARFNRYLPTQKEYTVAGNLTPGISGFSGWSYYVSQNTSQLGAMPGLDLEIGGRLPIFTKQDNHQLRGYTAVYQFRRENYTPISGSRARLEWLSDRCLERWHIPNTRLKIGAEVARDTVRGWQSFFSLGLRLHWGSKQSSSVNHRLDQLFQKPIERDVDVLTGAKGNPSTLLTDNTGKNIAFYHVNANAASGGDGTIESPFDSMQQAFDASIASASSSPNSVIYLTGNITGANARMDLTDTTSLSSLTVSSHASSFTQSGQTIAATTSTVPVLNGTSAAVLSYDQSVDTTGTLATLTWQGIEARSSSNTMNLAADNTVTLVIQDSTIGTAGINKSGILIDNGIQATLSNLTIEADNSGGIGVSATNGSTVSISGSAITAVNIGVKSISSAQVNIAEDTTISASTALSSSSGGVVVWAGH